MFDNNIEPWNNQTNQKTVNDYLASNSYLSLQLVSCCFVVTNGKTNFEAFKTESSAKALVEEYHKIGTRSAKEVHYIKLDILD